MSKFSVPPTGTTIDRTHSDTQTFPQIIRLKLPKSDTRDLIKHVREGGTSRLKTGRHLAIEFGTKRVSVHQGTDSHPEEIFAGALDGSNPIHFCGKLSYTLEVLQAKEATASTDFALEKLKNNLRQSQEERALQESGITSSKALKHGPRPSPLSGGLMSSRPSSPFLGAGFSPRVGPTSAPLLSGQSKQEKIKLDAIRIAAIHLLAMEPQDVSKLVEKLRVKKADLDRVLLKVAKDGKSGKKELKDRSYRDLDVWKFPYTTQGDRQRAIENAISAFDRQRIDKTDTLWQILLAKEDRGKGIYLSKLNFDKPLATGNLTPKLPERSTDSASTGGKSMNSQGSGNSNQKGKVPMPKSADKPKLTAEQIAKNLKKIGNKEAIKESGRHTAAVKDITKAPPLKHDVKLKSSEKIIDSDEEADRGPSLPRKTSSSNDAAQQTVSRPEKPAASSSRAPLHISNLSGSSGSGNESDRNRLTPAAMVRTRRGKDTNDIGETFKISSSAQNRNPSRPRNGSSPTKPSPLGSSPPTNMRDVDTSSNSSKGTTLSSAPSSPPSTAGYLHGQKGLSPVMVAHKSDKLTNGVKRKAEPHDAAPPAKKQQGNPNGLAKKNEAARFNALPASLNDAIDPRATPKRASPDSDVSSGSDKSLTADQIVREAKKFRAFYARYKDLHDKLNKQKDEERKDDDVDRVWSMHRRLAEMKDKIWKDWEKVEKTNSQ